MCCKGRQAAPTIAEVLCATLSMKYTRIPTVMSFWIFVKRARDGGNNAGNMLCTLYELSYPTVNLCIIGVPCWDPAGGLICPISFFLALKQFMTAELQAKIMAPLRVLSLSHRTHGL